MVGALPALAMVVNSKRAAKKVYGVGPKVEYVAGEYVLQMRVGVSTKAVLSSQLAKMGFELKQTINAERELFLVKSSGVQIRSQQAAISSLSQMAGVEFAEPNYLYRIADVDAPEVTPNDPKFADLWAMKNVGQNDSSGRAGKAGSDVGATKAWAIEKGSKNIVVAVIDTGVDYTHPDLKDNIWSMPGKPDVHGYNAITDKEDPMDDHSHGSHCSGTIGAKGDDGVGVVGINWHTSIMGVKFLSASGSGTLADAVKAIDWATAHGANVMSNSWGGGGFSQALLDAITRANDKGILFIAAAGNDGSNNDSAPSYPASYDVANVVAVAASGNTDVMANFSNYGRTKVALMAPGENIVSSVIGGKYDSYSGTSMATPHVSGAAALLLSKEPSLTPTQVKDRLMATSDKIRTYRTKIKSSGRLNVYNLLTNTIPPGPISVPDSAWSALVTNVLETDHPYPMNGTKHFEIKHPGAKFVRVHFAKFQTEAGYDTLTIKNAKGEVIDTLSGSLGTNLWSVEADGDTIVLDFKSDDSANDYGFQIDGYSWTSFGG